MLLGITGVISGTTISKEAPTLDTTGPASTDTMSAHYTPSAAPTRSADRACALASSRAVAQQGALHAALPGSVVSILGERRQLDPLPPHIWSAAAQTLNSTVSWRLDWLDSATTCTRAQVVGATSQQRVVAAACLWCYSAKSYVGMWRSGGCDQHQQAYLRGGFHGSRAGVRQQFRMGEALL